MPDVQPQFESQDAVGSTTPLAGVVGLTPIQVPASPGPDISEILVRCPSQTPNSVRLLWSVDNVTYHELSPGEFVGWGLKGSVKQVWLKGSVAGVKYEVLLNREAT